MYKFNLKKQIKYHHSIEGLSMTRVLFILKRRPDYDQTVHNHIGLSTGLYNSASFMDQMLRDAGIESRLAVTIDNNGIDKEVNFFKPTHVIIEALWVVPTKFDILCKLHPSVNWIVRIHSEMPFIASEGIAMDWMSDYVRFPNISIGVNAPRMLDETKFYLQRVHGWSDAEASRRVIYLPNFYPQEFTAKVFNPAPDVINISCFGAIRPLKNQLLQAIAAIKFADSIGRKLRFHVNSGRVEMKGEPVEHNLTALFENIVDTGHILVKHQWCPRDEFLQICAKMDIAMQVSFSETFNIVGADHISQGVPMVCSNEVPWASPKFCANPVDSDDMYNKLLKTWYMPDTNVMDNQTKLVDYTSETKLHWLKHFK